MLLNGSKIIHLSWEQLEATVQRDGRVLRGSRRKWSKEGYMQFPYQLVLWWLKKELQVYVVNVVRRSRGQPCLGKPKTSRWKLANLCENQENQEIFWENKKASQKNWKTRNILRKTVWVSVLVNHSKEMLGTMCLCQETWQLNTSHRKTYLR